MRTTLFGYGGGLFTPAVLPQLQAMSVWCGWQGGRVLPHLYVTDDMGDLVPCDIHKVYAYVVGY